MPILPRLTALFEDQSEKQQITRVAWLYCALITVGELAMTFLNPRVGIFTHIFIVLFLLYQVANDNQHQRFYTALFLLPLIRLLSLGMPLYAWTRQQQFMYVAIPAFFASLVVIRQEKWGWRELGFTWESWPLQLLIASSGFALGWLEYQILRPNPLLPVFSWQNAIQTSLILIIFTGLLEELIFRSMVQTAAVRLLGRWHGIILTALLFAVMHIGYASLTDVIFVFLVGVFFGDLFVRTRSLLGITLAHGITNVSLFILWPLVNAI